MGGPGQRRLGNRYELRTLLATGGMGQVWRAWDTLLDRPVAVKVLRSEFTGDPTFVARFRAEARHTAALAHRNIAALHDYGEVTDDATGEQLAYLVMELVEGEALSDLLAREPRLPVDRTLDVLQQTAAALAAAHAAGVVHRDVKPGNVLVGADGVVKITDFGIAWSASSIPLTQTGQVVGTAHYLSPEQAAGAKAGPASDVYALGLIGYECLAGRRAFDGDNSVQIALMQLRDSPDPLPDHVPENVRRLIGRALLKDPDARFADGAAFAAAVADVRAGRMLTPPPVDGGTRRFAAIGTVPAPRRRAGRVVGPLAALLTGAGIALGGIAFLGQEPVAPVAEAGPASVVLAAADYVGRPVDEVEAALGELGLTVERVAEETTDQAPGLVTGLTPAGAVRQGSTVTVSYAVAPQAEPAPAADPTPQVPEAPQGTATMTEVAVSGPAAGVPADGAPGAGGAADAPAPPAAGPGGGPAKAGGPAPEKAGGPPGKAGGHGRGHGKDG